MPNSGEERAWKPLKSGPFIDRIGPILAAREPDGSFVYGLQTGDDHANALGIVHGGVLTTLLDQAIAVNAWFAADRAPTVTVQMDTRFVSAARPGDFLEARATMRSRAGSVLYFDAEVTDADRPVALATAVMKISRKQGEA